MRSDVLNGRAERLGKPCTLLEGEVRGGWGARGAFGSSRHKGHCRVLGRQRKKWECQEKSQKLVGWGGMLVFEWLEGNFGAWHLTPQCQGNVVLREK